MSTSPAIDLSELSEIDPSVWKQEVSARVKAHRTRRPPTQPALTGKDSTVRHASSRSAGVAASVAERYAAALSYSEYLSQLSHPEPESKPSQAPRNVLQPDNEPTESNLALSFSSEGSCALEAMVTPSVDAEAALQPSPSPETIAVTAAAPALDFLEEVTVEPDVPLTTKLIEFPRQLVAARRARPRLAEGPLRDPSANPGTAAASPQLRIFEVEEEEISRAPLAPSALNTPPAEWHYIQLDTPLLSTLPQAAPASQAHPLLDVAPLDRRLMAASVDLGLVTLGFLVFALGFIAIASTPPSDSFALISAAIVFSCLFATYQWLFFSMSDATPGMRYARIALCTFHDENPLKRMRRSRVVASLFSLAAGGLGFAWAWFDRDRLSWHDRLSHTYQRCY